MSLLMDVAELEKATVETKRGKAKKPVPAFFAPLVAALVRDGKAAVPAALWSTKNANRFRKEWKESHKGFAVSAVARKSAAGDIVGYIITTEAIEA